MLLGSTSLRSAVVAVALGLSGDRNAIIAENPIPTTYGVITGKDIADRFTRGCGTG